MDHGTTAPDIFAPKHYETKQVSPCYTMFYLKHKPVLSTVSQSHGPPSSWIRRNSSLERTPSRLRSSSLNTACGDPGSTAQAPAPGMSDSGRVDEHNYMRPQHRQDRLHRPIPPASTPNSSGSLMFSLLNAGESFYVSLTLATLETKGDKAESSQLSIQKGHGRQRETKGYKRPEFILAQDRFHMFPWEN